MDSIDSSVFRMGDYRARPSGSGPSIFGRPATPNPMAPSPSHRTKGMNRFADHLEDTVDILKEKVSSQHEEYQTLREEVDALRQELAQVRKEHKADFQLVERWYQRIFEQGMVNMNSKDKSGIGSTVSSQVAKNMKNTIHAGSKVKKTAFTGLRQRFGSNNSAGSESSAGSSKRNTPRGRADTSAENTSVVPAPFDDASASIAVGAVRTGVAQGGVQSTDNKVLQRGNSVASGATLNSDESSLVLPPNLPTDFPMSAFRQTTPQITLDEAAADMDHKETLRLLVPYEGIQLLMSNATQLLAAIAKDTLTNIHSSPLVDGRNCILCFTKLTRDGNLEGAVNQCNEAVQANVPKDHRKVTVLVREKQLTNQMSMGDWERSFGVKLEMKPMRIELQRIAATHVDAEDSELEVKGHADNILRFLGRLVLAATAPLNGPMATEEDSEGTLDGRHESIRQMFTEKILSMDNMKADEAAKRSAEEKLNVRLHMEQFGLTERRSSDLPEDVIAIAATFAPKTPRGYLLRLVASTWFSVFSFLCILGNFVVMKLEVDTEKDSPESRKWRHVQFGITSLFMSETALTLFAVPHVWRFKEIMFDSVVVTAAFVLELVGYSFSLDGSAAWLLLLRLVRFMRFIRLIRNKGPARTIRVLTASLSGAMTNLFWTSMFLLLVFYCTALIFRNLIRDSDNTDDLASIVDEFFPNVSITLVTLIGAYLDSFDYGTNITRPLIDQSALMGGVWLAFHLLVRIVIVNLIAGLFIEQLQRAALISDDASAKERYAENDLTFKHLEAVFAFLDQNNEGYITHNDLYIGWTNKEDVEKLLQITRPPFHGDHLAFFHYLDVKGTGELRFTEFAYGVIAIRCGSKHIDKMLLDQASKSLIRQSAQCKKYLDIASKQVEESAERIVDIGRQVLSQRGQYIRHFGVLQNRLDKLREGIQGVYDGLEICRPDPTTTGPATKSLLTVSNVREAHCLKDQMRELTLCITAATDMTQSKLKNLESEGFAHSVRLDMERLRDTTDREISRGLEILRKHEASAVYAARTAARAARAIATVHASPNISPAPSQRSTNRSMDNPALKLDKWGDVKPMDTPVDTGRTTVPDESAMLPKATQRKS